MDTLEETCNFFISCLIHNYNLSQKMQQMLLNYVL